MSRHHAGGEWLAARLLERGHQLYAADFGWAVADLLGDAARGLYHLEWSVLCSKSAMEWLRGDGISIEIFGPLPTYDGDFLTRLVVLAHNRCIRLTIGATDSRHTLNLHFAKRQRRGRRYERHPTMEEAVAGIREELG